ncbi:MAG: DNA primase, partial [Nitrosopumilaceae archaeon]|nr:DNA primase [Nitrosopumilaceae archaeon]
LNSKSGLTKIFCKDLKTFDPYSDSSFLDENSVEIKANCPVEFKLRKKKFGPFYDEQITVPTYAAAYMICKNLATIY